MAIDKAVDSVQLEADLTAVADAIRTKGGTSDALVFPGGFISAIEAIQAGSGGLAYDMGEFTVEADATTVSSVPHNLGKKPDVLVVWTDYFAGKLDADNVNTEFTNDTNVFAMSLESLTGFEIQQLTSTNSLTPPIKLFAKLYPNEYRLSVNTPSSYVYAPFYVTETEIKSLYTGNAYWRAGITYKYFVCEKWW